jgi:alanyl-tRNA synthetase
VQELSEELKKVRRELDKALAPDLGVELGKLRAAAVHKDGVHTVVFERPGMQGKDAQELLRLAQKELDPFAGVVLSLVDGECHVVAAVSPKLVAKVKAGDLVKQLAGLLGGGGGGRPEAAQGKGKDGTRLPEAAAAAAGLFASAGLR